jgi:ABC-type transport system involved in cytochrome c biogenesis ATPase subunit
MRLLKIEIRGYRRFEGPTELRILGPVTAIVGPNEAGKTSLLRAIAHLTKEEAFERREFTGRTHPDPTQGIVRAVFEVEAIDLKQAGIEDVLTIEDRPRFGISKRPGESHIRSWLEPHIHRDLQPRVHMIARLRDPKLHDALTVGPDEPEGEADDALHQRAVLLGEMLEGSDEDLSEEQQQRLREFAEALPGPEDDGDNGVHELRTALQTFIEDEAAQNPYERARRALHGLTPRFLFFEESERQIEDHYRWADHGDAPPSLANLLYLAGVSYADYRTVATDPDRADELQTVERGANQQLEERLGVWTQASLTVTLRGDAEGLRVFALESAIGRDTPLSERSAGLRTFVALVAFAVRYGGGQRPILLIDEAETHLHYGAQADLVEVFAGQRGLANIIYTTHSIGCLPEDLGTGVRAIQRRPERERSTIENSVWEGGAGMSPVLIAMGASVLAFTAARHALIGEGQTEAILLPSLFAAARGVEWIGRSLGFQVAPGLAVTGPEATSELEGDAGTVAYVVDDDEGGRSHAAKIPAAAHHAGRVLMLGEGQMPGLCIEDLVDGDLLTLAFNEVLARTRPDCEDRLAVEDLPKTGRGGALDQFCRLRGARRSASRTLLTWWSGDISTMLMATR